MRNSDIAPPIEIFNSPATRFVLDFIGAVNYLLCTPTGEANGRLTFRVRPGCRTAQPSSSPSGPRIYIIISSADAKGIAAHVEMRSFVGETFESYLRVDDLLVTARTDKLAEFPERAEVRAGVRDTTSARYGEGHGVSSPS